MLLNILAGFTYNIMNSGIILFFFLVNTFVFYYSFLGFGIRDCLYTGTSFCGFVIWLYKRWFGFTLIKAQEMDSNFKFNQMNNMSTRFLAVNSLNSPSLLIMFLLRRGNI
jgi:hypothetical protein